MTIGRLSYGDERGRGNLLGLQARVTSASYVSAGRLHAHMDGLLKLAQTHGWLGPQTIAVLPEYLGTWLVALSGPPATFRASSIAAATLPLLLQRPAALLQAIRQSHAPSRIQEALFRSRAHNMAQAYQSIMARLARDYRVTLVGGSIVLPAPRVEQGRLICGVGPLENSVAVFQADGRPYPALARKIYPIDDEKGFVAPAPLDRLPVFETPAGRLGVMVCADSWYPDVYAALRDRGAELLAVPSYLAPDGAWEKPWGGYNGGPPPADIHQGDIGQISEGQAWLRYAMASRAPQAGFRAGINVFLRGQIWDLGADGRTVGFLGGQTIVGPPDDAPALVNVWL
jgi:hypothetical protein